MEKLLKVLGLFRYVSKFRNSFFNVSVLIFTMFCSMAHGQFSGGGSGIYTDEIYWLDFSTFVTSNNTGGETFGPTTVTLPGGAILNITITELVSSVRVQNISSNRALYPLYSPSGTGNCLRNFSTTADAHVNISVTATLNGNTFPVKLAFADGEASGFPEGIDFTINGNSGSNWVKIDELNPSLFNESGLGTQNYIFNGTGSPSTGYGTPVVYTEQTTASPLDLDIALRRLAGGTGVAIGVFIHEDYGDAPGYAEAIHTFSTDFVAASQIYLGTNIPDSDGVNSLRTNADATADSDEAISVFDPLTSLTDDYSVDVVVNNTSGTTGNLYGWIDFDGNGVFDADEYTTTTVANGTTNGIATLTWNGILGSSPPVVGTTFSRFRFTTDTLGAADAAGNTFDGEVEDYQMPVLHGSVITNRRITYRVKRD